MSSRQANHNVKTCCINNSYGLWVKVVISTNLLMNVTDSSYAQSLTSIFKTFSSNERVQTCQKCGFNAYYYYNNTPSVIKIDTLIIYKNNIL